MSELRQPKSYIGKIVVLGLLLCVAALGLYPSPRRSFIGRAVRFAGGEPGAKQTANDLAEELLSRKELSGLQDWSAGVLSRYGEGTLKTSGKAAYWSAGSVKLAPQEVPDFLKHAWHEQPEVAIRISASGSPECVTVCWYLYGILVGPHDYTTSLSPWYLRTVRPGIYTYFFEK